jgi:hypothetical protein
MMEVANIIAQQVGVTVLALCVLSGKIQTPSSE